MASLKRERPSTDTDDDKPSRRRDQEKENTTTITTTTTTAATAADDDDDSDDGRSPPTPMPPPAKRRRVAGPHIPPRDGRDLLSPLSDELLLRILSFLPLRHLLAVAPVSRRLYRLSSDSQLWKALYYTRFVLPRAMRIPGFRDGRLAGTGSGTAGTNGSRPGHRLHYAGRRTLWADGRRGGIVARAEEGEEEQGRRRAGWPGPSAALDSGVGGLRTEEEEEEETAPRPVNWKRQYKIRYNWARGKCAVEELKLGGDVDVGSGEEERRMLVKVVEGVAVTADRAEGLRAWDLKTRSLITRIDIGDGDTRPAPSCIAVDDAALERGVLDVALGFTDGSFGVWRLFTQAKHLTRRYRHEKSSNGELIAMAFSYPFLLTATQSVLISLYTFQVPSAADTDLGEGGANTPGQTQGNNAATKEASGQNGQGTSAAVGQAEGGNLPAPYLLTALDSHTSRPPLALSIRRAAKTTIASVAYTFSTRRGWSIGIQDLHIRQAAKGIKSAPEITTTRIAYTTPVESACVPQSPLSPPATPGRGHTGPTTAAGSSATTSTPTSAEPGPITLCYTHPYLLATLPDNTLILHMCTSNASSLSISDGIRLWGHTSGISDAEITSRGKAVSVSTRGEEMRVWELEGRTSGVGSRSVEIRPWQSPASPGAAPGSLAGDGLQLGDPARDWDERRNWVGFDDEMVIVLKERKGARESLMVYDFT